MQFHTNQHLSGNPKIFGVPAKEVQYLLFTAMGGMLFSVMLFAIGAKGLSLFILVFTIVSCLAIVAVLVKAASQKHPSMLSTYFAYTFLRKKYWPVVSGQFFIPDRDEYYELNQIDENSTDDQGVEVEIPAEEI